MDEHPLLSVNIVTRNRKDALAKALRSIRQQTYAPIEIVVVDNDSSDGTVDMLETDWPGVHLIKLHRNIGCQPGRNIGMKNCKGKYIFNLDDDGWLEPAALEQIVARFERDDRIGLIMAAIQEPGRSEDGGNAGALEHERVLGNFEGAAHAIRTAVLQEVGYFPEYRRGASESNLALRMIDHGYELIYLPSAVMHHELSAIERDANAHRFYHVWHDLENVCRLHPWSRIPLTCLWKALLHAYGALRHGTLRGYCAGMVRFFYEIPFMFAERTPVRPYALQKQQYLRTYVVTSIEEAARFERFTLWDMIKGRISQRGVRPGD